MRDIELRGAAVDLFACREPAVCIVGAAGTGKSVAAALKIHTVSSRVPNTTSLIVRLTHASLKASTLRSFETSIIADELASGKITWFGGSGRKPPAYMYPNGSVILVGGLDQPGKFLSLDLDRVFIDEASQIGKTAFEVLSTRMRGKAATYKQIVMATNPDARSHWIKESADAGEFPMLTSKHHDNPYLFSRDDKPTAMGDSYLTVLRSLSGIRRARYYEGKWISAEGAVWDGWSPDVHVIDPFPVPDEWRTVWAWDQGFQNPQVFQRWAVDGDGRAYLTHEISVRQRIVEDFASDILDLKETHGWKWPEAFVADHDGSDRATMERHLGIATMKARKAVGPGIQTVANRLTTQKDGKARLYVFRDAVVNRDPLAAADKRPRGLVAEIGGYVWQTIRGTDGVPKEEPVKQHDHSCDTARYAMMYLDGPAPKAGSPARPPNRDDSAGAVAGGVLSRPVGR